MYIQWAGTMHFVALVFMALLICGGLLVLGRLINLDESGAIKSNPLLTPLKFMMSFIFINMWLKHAIEYKFIVFSHPHGASIYDICSSLVVISIALYVMKKVYVIMEAREKGEPQIEDKEKPAD